MQYLNSHEFAKRLCINRSTFSTKLSERFIPEATRLVRAKRGAHCSNWLESDVDAFISDIVKRAKETDLDIRTDRLVEGFGFDPITLKNMIRYHEVKGDPAINFFNLTLNTLSKLGA